MDLGKTIKAIRKQRGKTQEEFSALCDISQTYLSQIENGQKEPTLATLKTISNTLDIPLPILFFLSMNEEDIHPSKRKAFKSIGPSLKMLINEFFPISKE